MSFTTISVFECARHGLIQRPETVIYQGEDGTPLCACERPLSGPFEVVPASLVTPVIQRAMQHARRQERSVA